MAIFDSEKNKILVNLISSQVAKHAEFGGIVPEWASRMHAEKLASLFSETLRLAKIRVEEIFAVAVTNVPGLIGCLLVGTSFAKALAYRLKIPLIAVNHLEAHLFSPFIGSVPEFPFLGLVVSGGHTAFYRAVSFTEIQLVGQTVDDAAGEAFDKTAKLMGLEYPGGPIIDKLARTGNADAYAFTPPKVKMGPQYLSFSGIKTALYHHLEAARPLNETKIKNLAASLQKAIVDSLMQKAEYFLSLGDYKCFGVSGGVAMNSLLRARTAELCQKMGVPCWIAAPEFCTDNAAMVAYLAAHRAPEENPFELTTMPSRKIQARQLAKGRG